MQRNHATRLKSVGIQASVTQLNSVLPMVAMSLFRTLFLGAANLQECFGKRALATAVCQ